MAESLLIILGLLLASIILAGAVDNQQSQLKRISHAKQVIFDAIEGKKESYPESLKNIVEQMIKDLNRNENKLCWFLRFYRIISWIPVLTGLAVFLYRYPSNLISFFK